MSKATYTAAFESFAGSDCLFIADLNQGGMSVTNDIENIVENECNKAGKIADDLLIVYCDSEGIWDGWDNKTEVFVPLNCANQYHAIRRWKKQLQEVTNFNTINTNKMNGDKTTDQVLDVPSTTIPATSMMDEVVGKKEGTTDNMGAAPIEESDDDDEPSEEGEEEDEEDDFGY